MRKIRAILDVVGDRISRLMATEILPEDMPRFLPVSPLQLPTRICREVEERRP